MKFTTLTTALTLTTTAAANYCNWSFTDGTALTTKTWVVGASGVDDIPGKCGGFWDNMNNSNFNGACAVSDTNCGEDAGGDMVINFNTGSGCNSGHVESAWYEATKNDFGAVDCP